MLSFHRLALLLIILGVGVLGCENSVEPYGNRADTYSIYGYLAENRQTQFIRVRRLDVVIADEEDSLDLTVRLKNLSNGRSEVLRDSTVSFTDQGSTVLTHNFWTDTPVQPDTRYRLILDHPDGETTNAETTTPASAGAIPSRNSTRCSTLVNVGFPPIRDPRRVRFLVTFKYQFAGSEDPRRLRFPGAGTVRRDNDGTVHAQFSIAKLLEDEFEAEDFREPDCRRVVSDRIPVFYTYLGPEWYGQIPDDSIRSSTESPYVVNGKGFFGALWRDSVSLSYIPPE